MATADHRCRDAYGRHVPEIACGRHSLRAQRGLTINYLIILLVAFYGSIKISITFSGSLVWLNLAQRLRCRLADGSPRVCLAPFK